MTPEEFRKAGHAIVDWIADYRERVGPRAILLDFPACGQGAPVNRTALIRLLSYHSMPPKPGN
jgi:hypothetical protein